MNLYCNALLPLSHSWCANCIFINIDVFLCGNNEIIEMPFQLIVNLNIFTIIQLISIKYFVML